MSYYDQPNLLWVRENANIKESAMLFRIIYLIFQNNRLSRTVEATQEFSDAGQLAQALARFAAQESAMRFNPKVMSLYTGAGPSLNLPPNQEGYGPQTNVVIKEIVPI
jgi:hypothetical protein